MWAWRREHCGSWPQGHRGDDGRAHEVQSGCRVSDLCWRGWVEIDQRLAQPYAGAQLEDLRGRDPRLWQLACEQEPQLQIAIAGVGLRAPLAAPPGGRLGRIGEPREMAGTLDLLNNETPAGRPLEHELGFSSSEPLEPLASSNVSNVI